MPSSPKGLRIALPETMMGRPVRHQAEEARPVPNGFFKWTRESAGLFLLPPPALATRAADGWTAISERLGAASSDDAPPTPWAEAAALAREVADVEQALFERLAAQAG